MNTQWHEICANLQRRLAPGTFKVWVEPLQACLTGDRLELLAPNDFVASWVRERLLHEVRLAATEVLGPSAIVRVSTAPPTPAASTETVSVRGGAALPFALPAPVTASSMASAASSAADPVDGARAPLTAREKPLPSPTALPRGPLFAHEQGMLPYETPVAPVQWRYSFDDFVVGPCNDLAHAAARNMVRITGSVDTLFVSSGPGLGKTHLTQAVGRALCDASNRSAPRVEYLTAETFATCFVQAMKTRTIDRFKQRFRDVDVLLLEDVHFLQNKEKMQDEVLSTIRTLHDRGSRVVLTSSFAPRELSNVDERLVSRFCAGFLAGMDKPDQATRRRILQDKARLQNTELDGDVCDLLAERLTGDVRQLESCLHNIILRAGLAGRAISLDMAREIIAQYAQDTPFFDLDSIIRKVCEAFGLAPTQLETKSRKSDLVTARNTIFYLARRHTDLSLAHIGEHFGRRHSTVLKGIAAVERELRRESPAGRQIANTLALIERNANL